MNWKRLLALVVTVVIVTVAAVCAGWKWGGGPHSSAGQQRLANGSGWTWDAGVLGQPGNGHENDGGTNP